MELVTRVAAQIYCTKLSLGHQNIDLSCIADDAFAIVYAVEECAERTAEQAP